MTHRETTCPKCGSLVGSTHTNEFACTTWLLEKTREAYRSYRAWKKRLEGAEAAWKQEARDA
jgi:hypothetical protein